MHILLQCIAVRNSFSQYSQMTKLTNVLKRRDVQHMQLAQIFLHMYASVILQLDTTTDRTLVILLFANARKTSRFDLDFKTRNHI